MPKRKKHHTTKRHYRRRRIGGVQGAGFKHDLEEVLGLVGASVVGTVMQRQLLAHVNPKIVSLGQIAVGYYLKNHSPSPILRGAGWGFLGTGAIGLTHEVGIIHGIEDLVAGIGNMYSNDMLSGYEEEKMIQGIDNRSYVSGMDNRQHVGDLSAYAVGM